MRIEDLVGKKYVVRFNSEDELRTLIRDHLAKISTKGAEWVTEYTSLEERVREGVEADYNGIDMYDDMYCRCDSSDYEDFEIIEARELFDKQMTTFHYINREGKKTSAQAEKISDIKDLKQLLYTITE